MGRQSRQATIAFAALCLAVALGSAIWAADGDRPPLRTYPPAAEDPGRLVVRSFALNPYNRALDGQWECSIVASDGNCYFGSSTHSFAVGSAFFKYDPQAKTLTCLSKNLMELRNDLGTPLEKVHSDIDEANGWLYFASKEGGAGRGSGKGGGVVLGYELATGTFRNFGVVHPGAMIYSGIAADPQRDRLWVTPISGDMHLYWLDVKTGDKKNVGSLPQGGACFYLFVDGAGDCWFTLRGEKHSRALFRASAADGKIERFDNALPEGADWWSWAQPLGDGRRAVVLLEKTMYLPSRLYVFDSTKVGTTEAFRFVKDLGICGLGNALAGNRFYIVQRPGGKRFADGGSGQNDLRLHSLVIPEEGEAELVNHGIIVDQDGRYPMRIHALSADTKGRVFMTGDWWLLPGEKGTDKSTDRVGQGILNRGQFFAVAELAAAE